MITRGHITYSFFLCRSCFKRTRIYIMKGTNSVGCFESVGWCLFACLDTFQILPVSHCCSFLFLVVKWFWHSHLIIHLLTSLLSYSILSHHTNSLVMYYLLFNPSIHFFIQILKFSFVVFLLDSPIYIYLPLIALSNSPFLS